MDRERDDEAGHLLANSLGGSDKPENFAPQSRMMNRAVTPITSAVRSCSWFDVEEFLRKFLKNNQSASVFWSLIVDYGLYPSSRRPTGFALSITFHDERGRLVNYEGGAVRQYYFPNVPTSACSDLKNSWWTHGHHSL